MSKIITSETSKLCYDDEDLDEYILKADFDNREVTTNCGESYYDLTIDFDDFINFAKHIKEKDKYNKGNK